MTLDKTRIQEITTRIIKEIHPTKIYLFGSYAKGTAGPESDLDLVVIADIPGSKNKRSLKIRSLFPKRDFSLDVFVYHEDEFNDEIKIANTLGNIIASEGKLIYAG